MDTETVTQKWLTVRTINCKQRVCRRVVSSNGEQSDNLSSLQNSLQNNLPSSESTKLPPDPLSNSHPISDPPKSQSKSQTRFLKRKKCCVVNENYASRTLSDFSRTNGLDKPLNILQITSWVLLTANAACTALLLLLATPFVPAICFGVVESLLFISSALMGARVTLCNPVAPTLDLESGSTEAVCDLCGPIDATSKHCRACNKCVKGFDHHCKWLNNCVGEANYRDFLVLISLVAVLTLLPNLLVIYNLVVHWVAGSTQPIWRVGGYHSLAFYVIEFLVLALNFPLFVLVVQLLSFHIFLVKEGMTTYEYISTRVANVAKEDEIAETEKKNACCLEWVVIDKNRLAKKRKGKKSQTPVPPLVLNELQGDEAMPSPVSSQWSPRSEPATEHAVPPSNTLTTCNLQANKPLVRQITNTRNYVLNPIDITDSPTMISARKWSNRGVTSMPLSVGSTPSHEQNSRPTNVKFSIDGKKSQSFSDSSFSIRPKSNGSKRRPSNASSSQLCSSTRIRPPGGSNGSNAFDINTFVNRSNTYGSDSSLTLGSLDSHDSLEFIDRGAYLSSSESADYLPVQVQVKLPQSETTLQLFVSSPMDTGLLSPTHSLEVPSPFSVRLPIPVSTPSEHRESNSPFSLIAQQLLKRETFAEPRPAASPVSLNLSDLKASLHRDTSKQFSFKSGADDSTRSHSRLAAISFNQTSGKRTLLQDFESADSTDSEDEHRHGNRHGNGNRNGDGNGDGSDVESSGIISRHWSFGSLSKKSRTLEHSEECMPQTQFHELCRLVSKNVQAVKLLRVPAHKGVWNPKSSSQKSAMFQPCRAIEESPVGDADGFELCYFNVSSS